MTAEAEQALGQLVRHHMTDNARRGRSAVISLIAGVLFTAVGIPLVTAYTNSPAHSGPSLLPGVTLGLGLVGLGYGANCVLTAARTRGEVFAVHERGLDHRRSGTESVIRWTDIRTARRPGAACRKVTARAGAPLAHRTAEAGARAGVRDAT